MIVSIDTDAVYKASKRGGKLYSDDEWKNAYSEMVKKYISNDILLTNQIKEKNMMNDILVKFGGKTYKPYTIRHKRCCDAYPELSLELELSPRMMVADNDLGIKNVIFNPPATIVFWADGTKTVVKARDERFDPEKGLAMAIAKKAMGNKGNYFNQIKKWTDQYIEKTDVKMTMAEPVTFELHNVKFNDEEFGKMIGEVNPRKKLFHFEFKPNKDDK